MVVRALENIEHNPLTQEVKMNQITYQQLHDAVAGSAVGLRSRTILQPAGGAGDKIFPPTYAVASSSENKYAVEERQLGDSDKISTTVLLDSVASQANRAELALLEGWERGELDFPVPYVDFSDDEGATDYEKLTVLEAPHRLADAIFRDSLLDGTLFRLSEVGRAITNATPRNAIDLFRYSPTSLLFGMWDSTGPKGGLGSRFQRSYVSEIVGFDAQTGKKVGSRIDPLQIEKVTPDDRLYNSANPEEVWTPYSEQAAKDKKGQLIYAARAGASGEAGQPSKINHGNIPPGIDDQAGGVTISSALQTTVISFASLRRLRCKGYSRDAETALHVAVAALGIAAIAYQHEMDFDLRSRCLLVPTHPPKLEWLHRDGSTGETVEVDRISSARILREAAEKAETEDVGWSTDKIRLVPAPKLLELLQRSRKLSATEATVE